MELPLEAGEIFTSYLVNVIALRGSELLFNM